MMASLPTELIQIIQSYLDDFSFEAARCSCRRWHEAACDAFGLEKRLERFTYRSRIERTPSADLQTMRRRWTQVSRSMMLRAQVRRTECDNTAVEDAQLESKSGTSPDGRRLVTLSDRAVKMYATDCGRVSATAQALIGERLLSDLRTACSGAPVLRNAPVCIFELAVARHSNLVAVALDRTIQIYDLDQPDSCPAAAYVPDLTGHFITGLEFAMQDSLLRVKLSNKGAVVYLGNPPSEIFDPEYRATLEYWKSYKMLKTLFLDSKKLVAKGSSREPPAERFTAVQLLRRQGDGWLFVSQWHRPTKSSYCLGFYQKRDVRPDEEWISSALNMPVAILLDLKSTHPSQISGGPSFWATEPTVDQQLRGTFILSDDGKLLALADEANTDLSRIDKQSRIFVWRVDLYQSDDAISESQKASDMEGFTTPRLPLYLGELAGNVSTFYMRQSDAQGYSIQLSTTLRTCEVVLSGV